jgi:FkbM family methyltransferase
MTLQRFRAWTWSLLASHSDSPFVCAARNAVDRLSELLHAENHDFRTNGETKVLECVSAAAPTILDVGANHGAWALEARRHCPTARIYCFEISSETRKHLRENLGGLEGIEILEFGLADRSGLERVKYYPDQDTRTSIYDYPVGESYSWNEYPVQTGDKFIQELGLQYIDLLKIDTEGADFRVLRGFEDALTRGAISVVQFEYGYACILARALLIDFYDYLESRGYIVGKLHSKRVDFRPYRLKDENFFGPNFVAVHRSHGEIIARLADPSWRPNNHSA